MTAFLAHFMLAAPLFVLVLAGYLFVRVSRWPSSASDALTRFVFSLALPALLFQLMSGLSRLPPVDGRLLLAFFGGCFIVFGIGRLLGRVLFRLDGVSQSVFALGGIFSNNVLLGVPYAKSVLGEAALRQQKWDQAAAELQKSLELDSNFDQAMTALARALHEKGDDAGARQWLEKALQRNSQNFRAWYELGWLQARTGNNQDAQAAYEKVLAIQPNFALAQRDLGLIYFDRKDYQHATPYLLQATQLGLKEARVFNFLGICYSLTGRLSQAVRTYHKALQLDPGLADAHLNLGYAYEQLQRKGLARQEYQQACHLKADLCDLIKTR